MPKPIETKFGPALLHSASASKTKAKWRLSFSDLTKAPAGLQVIKASRLGTAQEPNLYLFRVDGLRGQHPQEQVAQRPEDAIRAYLRFPAPARGEALASV